MRSNVHAELMRKRLRPADRMQGCTKTVQQLLQQLQIRVLKQGQPSVCKWTVQTRVCCRPEKYKAGAKDGLCFDMGLDTGNPSSCPYRRQKQLVQGLHVTCLLCTATGAGSEECTQRTCTTSYEGEK